MMEYEQYIDKLKKSSEPINFDQMYSQIQDRTAKMSPFPKIRLYFAGAITLFVIAFVVYLNFFVSVSNGETMLNYVLEDEEVNGSPLITYVLYE